VRPRLSSGLPFPSGTVFLAFGFNMVDVGGLLGGRLDEDIVRVPAKATTKGTSKAGGKPEVKRAVTM
jgi:hypothetical protein